MKKGLPSHFAKMGFKKGWKAYKASRGGSHKIHGTRKRKSSDRVHHAVMLDGDYSRPVASRGPAPKITPNKIFSPILDLMLLIAGMAVGAGIKKVSPVKNPHLMNGVQGVAGLGGSLFTKNRYIRLPLLGVALQSGISELKILFPKMVPLAGDDEVVYLPMEGEPEQIEMRGEDGRIGEAIDGEEGYGVPSEIEMQGEDGRMGEAIDGEEEEMSGEGQNN